jgi:DNA helicase-2/ATP-dependent DNA helicase PcrA
MADENIALTSHQATDSATSNKTVFDIEDQPGGRESRILRGLNSRQREVVLHQEGPLLVLAGAGSGKTRAIAHRAGFLVSERHVPPSSILCLTFTNKAAEEMRERIEALIGETRPERRSGVAVMTFHSFGARLLRSHHALIERTPRFSIYDKDDTLRILRQVLKESAVACSPELVLEDIDQIKNKYLIAGKDLKQRFEADAEYLALLKEVYQHYEQILARFDAVDFTDLLLKPFWILKEKPAVLNQIRHRFRHFLVDEYQDTCPLQDQIIQLLASPEFNLCTVGDDDQAIYTFRGADLDGILTFQQRYPNAKIIRMEQNYRSSDSIIEAARRAIEQNARRLPKSIFTDNPPGKPVEVVAFPTEQEEATWISKNIAALITQGVAPSEVAILCRVSSLFRPTERELSAALIPYVIVDGLSFWERREIKDIVAYLRLISNPKDYLSFQRIANTPARRVGKKILQSIDAKVKGGSAPDEVIQNAAAECAGLARLSELVMSLRGENRSVGQLIEALLEKLNYEAYLIKQFPSDCARRSANLQQLIDIGKKFDREQNGGLSEFLIQTGLHASADKADDKGNSVQLMTIHAAKGLEFTAVFLIGLEEGVLPHARSRSNPDEERRLFYVAITRAKERLYLSWTGCRTIQGKLVHNKRSTFIKSLLCNTADGRRNPSRTSSPAITFYSP